MAPTLQAPKSLPPEAKPYLASWSMRLIKPVTAFLQFEAASGLLLLAATIIALVWANSPWAETYTQFWGTSLSIRFGSYEFSRDLLWYVNDILMAIFFFVVGMEIRQEMSDGVLAEWRAALLPVGAAIGGMVVPALIYLMFAGGVETRHGWGIPMATDIAFALGILSLLGRRVPIAVRMLLLTIAVIDDLGAIVVIALFYSNSVAPQGLIFAAAGVLLIILMQLFGVRKKPAYFVGSVCVWLGIYNAGVHPTIAGVIVGLLVPVRAWLGVTGFTAVVHEQLPQLGTEQKHLGIKLLDFARRELMSPAASLIHTLHPWVAYAIMPIFALANAGVSISTDDLGDLGQTTMLAVILALMIGKPVGILIGSLGLVALRIANLPAGVKPGHLLVLGLLAGIGFTMSLFITALAFADQHLIAAAKLGVLVASSLMAVVALIVGWWRLNTTNNYRQ